MKILIAGGGKVGATLTRQLSAEGYDITLIDIKQQRLDLISEKYDVMTVQGNGAALSTLVDAGVRDADILIAVMGADELNLLCCMTAHGINPNLHTIARICTPEYANQVFLMRDVFALSMTFNPEKQAAVEIEHLLKFPGFLRRDTFAKGRVEIVELRVDSKSRLCDTALSDMYKTIKCKVLVCCVLRDGTVVAPDGNFVLRAGDRIFVTAPTDNLTTLLNNLGVITRRVKRVIICGGGRISYYLAKQLEQDNISVQIIENDPQRCIKLADLLPDSCVVNGDASSQSLLDSEGLADCDALVTVTGMDELNIIISIYGNNCGVPQIITKLGHMENNSMTDQLPIGSLVCPKDLCCSAIVRYVRAMRNQAGAAYSIHSIADGKAEALEFRVDNETLHTGEQLKNLKLKKNILISCITHGGETEIPSGDSVYSVGDTVIVVSTRGDVIYQMNDIFE